MKGRKKLEREIIIKTAEEMQPPNWSFLAEIIARQIIKGEMQHDGKSNV